MLQRLAANLLTGWDVDKDGKLDVREIIYVLDEFCGEVRASYFSFRLAPPLPTHT